MLRQVNTTTITIIPKVPNPSYFHEYRPIACCTTVYKIISKILVDRLQSVIGSLVGFEQVAFIPGRNLQDNVLMAHELVNGYSRKNIFPRAMIKVDIKKTYD